MIITKEDMEKFKKAIKEKCCDEPIVLVEEGKDKVED